MNIGTAALMQLECALNAVRYSLICHIAKTEIGALTLNTEPLNEAIPPKGYTVSAYILLMKTTKSTIFD